MWMNEYEIEEAVRLADVGGYPVALRGAQILFRLRSWTNRNSDGWPYWQKPGRAASRLMELLYERYLGAWSSRSEEDITEAELAKVLRPIKAFLTRHGVSVADRRYILEGEVAA